MLKQLYAQAEERYHAASKVSGEKDKVASMLVQLDDTRKMVLTAFEERRHAEREARRSSKDADQSAKRSKSVSEMADGHRLCLEQAEKENSTLS